MEYVWSYPPGAPLLLPGEQIEKEQIVQMEHRIKSGVEIHTTHGFSNLTIYVKENGV